MSRLRLHVLTNGQTSTDAINTLSRFDWTAIDALHLREPQWTARELMEWVVQLHDHQIRIPVMIHDRLDVLLALLQIIPDFPLGLHAGFRSIPWHFIRPIIGVNTPLSISIHNEDELLRAIQAGADRCMYGHIYETNSKAGLPGRGLDALQHIRSLSPLPIVAIGGITCERIRPLIRHGADGIAVLSGLWKADHPATYIQQLRSELDTSIEERQS